MTAREHAERASELLTAVESTGKHPGRSTLPRFGNQTLVEATLLLATAHALTAQALAAVYLEGADS